MISRRHRVLTDDDIAKIAGTYHAWRSLDSGYEDIAGFCKSASLQEIRENDYVLTPGRYVGLEELEDDGISFEEKMIELTEELAKQFAESHALEAKIRKNLEELGYEI